MKARTGSILIASLGLALAAGIAAADQVYKWTDKDGHVHFSQTPPPTTAVQAQAVTVNVPPPDPTSLQNQQNLVQQQLDEQAKQKEAADKNKPDANAEALKKVECDDLRSKLAVLQAGGRAATTDAKGNVTYLDDDARAKQEQVIQDHIAKNCGG